MLQCERSLREELPFELELCWIPGTALRGAIFLLRAIGGQQPKIIKNLMVLHGIGV